MQGKILKTITIIFVLGGLCCAFFVLETKLSLEAISSSQYALEEKYINNGEKYFKKGNYQMAADNVIKALSVNPHNEVSQVLLDKIISQLQIANSVKCEPTADERKNKFSTAMKAYQLNDYETAIVHLVELLEKNPKDTEAVTLITKINYELVKIKKQKIEVEKSERKEVIQLDKGRRNKKGTAPDY